MRAFTVVLLSMILFVGTGCEKTPAPPARPGGGGKTPAPPDNGGETTPPAPTENGDTKKAGGPSVPDKLPDAKPDAHLVGDKAWDTYSTGQKVWRQELAALMVKGKPKLKDVVQLDMKRHFARIDLAAARFRYLMENDAARLVRKEGIGAFVNFEWTSKDTARMRQEDPDAVIHEARERRLTKEVEAHATWEDSRKHFRNEVSLSPEFQEIDDRFKAKTDEAESMLGG